MGLNKPTPAITCLWPGKCCGAYLEMALSLAHVYYSLSASGDLGQTCSPAATLTERVNVLPFQLAARVCMCVCIHACERRVWAYAGQLSISKWRKLEKPERERESARKFLSFFSRTPIKKWAQETVQKRNAESFFLQNWNQSHNKSALQSSKHLQ